MDAISLATDTRLAFAAPVSASQNCGSSESEVRWPAILIERFCGPAMIARFYLVRRNHAFRPHQRVEFFFAHMAEPHRFLAQGRAVLMRGLGNLRCFVIADFR